MKFNVEIGGKHTYILCIQYCSHDYTCKLVGARRLSLLLINLSLGICDSYTKLDF